MTWKDITLKQFLEIQDIIQVQDDYTAINLINCIYNLDCEELPITELKKYTLDFLKTDIPEVKLKKHYTLNGRTYDSNFDLTVVTTAQFIDYNNYIKDPNYVDLLSVFFIPEGHKYNDGYDMKQVKEDLLQLDICTVKSAAFFFDRQLRILYKLFQHYSIKRLKKEKVDKKIIDKFKQVDLASLVSSLLSYPIAVQQMRLSRKRQENQ